MNKKSIIPISTEYIKLGQFLKFNGNISSGSEASIFLINNEVLVNNEVEKRRGRKLYKNYEIKINNTIFIIG
ncbi:MAG: RNA-binding S4 domain-containing protein [Mycoplasmoidaceae bacterium]